jgi:hypothetical protein
VRKREVGLWGCVWRGVEGAGEVGVDGEFVAEEGAGDEPFAIDGAGGDAEGFGGFSDGHADEDAEVDDVAEAGVELAEFFEGVIEGEEVDGGGGLAGIGEIVGERLAGAWAAAFEAFFTAGGIHEDAAHGFAGGRVEAVAVGPVLAVVGEELDVNFMDESGGLEGVAGGFGTHFGGGEAAKVVVNEGEKAGLGGGVAVGGGSEMLG